MIRPAIDSDTRYVISIVQRAYSTYVTRIGTEPAPMLENYAERISAGDVWVHESDEGSVQSILVLKEIGGTFLLENVAVDPDSQRTGIGRGLVAFAEAEATRRGFHELHLYTNDQMSENIRLYESLGFTIVARKTESGFRRVYLLKQT
jgi:ribosomal protein S18 acetylase RimI-like enzyme